MEPGAVALRWGSRAEFLTSGSGVQSPVSRGRLRPIWAPGQKHLMGPHPMKVWANAYSQYSGLTRISHITVRLTVRSQWTHCYHSILNSSCEHPMRSGWPHLFVSHHELTTNTPVVFSQGSHKDLTLVSSRAWAGHDSTAAWSWLAHGVTQIGEVTLTS